MAEFGAHLATAASELPSIFEVLAQENLTATLRPAFGHLLKVIAQLDISRFGVLWRWHEEIFSVLELALQHYCLKACGASFAENFYGLRRAPIGKETDDKNVGYKLPISHHRRVLLCLVMAPYLKSKLDNAFERLRSEDAQGMASNQASLRSRARSVFLAIYPLIHLSWEILVLLYQINYALGRNTFPSPLYQLSKTQLLTLTEEDTTSQPIMDLWNDIRATRWTHVPTVIGFHVLSNTRELFTSILSLGSFFLQFVEWWYSNSNLPADITVTIIPPPPRDTRQSLDPSVCPLCLRSRTNHTALSTSGCVFCYPCIYRHVIQNGKCPITQLPSSPANLIRLYPGNES